MTTPSRAEAEKIVEAWYRDTSQDVRVTYYDRDRLIDAFAAALDAARKVPEGCVRFSDGGEVRIPSDKKVWAAMAAAYVVEQEKP